MKAKKNLVVLLFISSIILSSCSNTRVKMGHNHTGNYTSCSACEKSLINNIDNNETSQISNINLTNSVNSDFFEENEKENVLSASTTRTLESFAVQKIKVKINQSIPNSYRNKSTTDSLALPKQNDTTDKVKKEQNKRSIWAWLGFVVAASGIFFLLSESALIIGPISFILCIMELKKAKKGTIARKFAVLGLILSILSILVLAHYLIVFVYLI